VTQKWHHLTESHLWVAVEVQKLTHTVHFTSYKAVARSRRESQTENDVTWPQVTRKWRHLTGSHLEVAAEGRKLASPVHFTFYRAVAHSRKVTWQEITSPDLRQPEVTSFDRKSLGSGCSRPKTYVYSIFHFLQGCSLQ